MKTSLLLRLLFNQISSLRMHLVFFHPDGSGKTSLDSVSFVADLLSLLSYTVTLIVHLRRSHFEL